MGAEPAFSRRALEVAEDLLAELDRQLGADGLAALPVSFRLDGTAIVLDRSGAETWIKESVDAGHPDVRHYIEEAGPGRVMVNLAAFEDPDSQYHP